MPLPPPPSAPTEYLIQLEVWDTVEANSGVRLGMIPKQQVLTATEHLEVGGEEWVEITVNPLWHREGTGFDLIHHRRVLRLVYDGGGFDEYRFSILHNQRKGEERGTRFRANGIKFDLAMQSKMLAWVQSNGLPLLHHELVGITAEDMLDAIIAQGLIPSYFAKGTVDATDKYTISWDWETHLSAIEEIGRITGLELNVRRNGTTNYLIDLIEDVAVGADIPEIRLGKSIINVSREEDSTALATLIYPKGEGPQGNAPTIADARFYAEAQAAEPTTQYRLYGWDGSEASVEFDLINEDDQFNGFFVEHSRGLVTAINDCSPALAGKAINVTLASAISIDKTVVRMSLGAAADGNKGMYYIPLPSKVSFWGESPMVLERLDIPGVTNLKVDPFIEAYPDAGMYQIFGGTVATPITGPDEHIHYGTGALKLEMDTGDALRVTLGNFSAWSSKRHDIVLNNPHLSFQTWLFLEVGQVENFMLFPQSGVFDRYPAVDAVDEETGEPLTAVSTDHIKTAAEDPEGVKDPGNFFHLTLEPSRLDFVDNTPFPAGWANNSITWHYSATKDGTVWYLDAIQMVNSPVIGSKIVRGSSALKLWDAAIRAFGRISTPTDVSVADPKWTIDMDALDVFRLDNAAYPYDEILPGVTVNITDAKILTVTRRVFSIERDLLNEALTKIELFEEDVD